MQQTSTLQTPPMAGPSRATSAHSAAYSGVSNRQSVLSERVIEREIVVPKKVVREEVIEKTIVVPERVLTEEVIEEVQKIREKIIEVAKPVIREKRVEVPDIHYLEKLVPVPNKRYVHKTKEVPYVTYRDRIIPVPKIVEREKIVEVPDIEYRDVPVERVVVVPEYLDQYRIIETPVPQYVDKIIIENVDVPVTEEFTRHVPVPVEATTTFEYTLPQLKARYNTVDLNMYVPRFIEVPVPAEFMEPHIIAQAEQYTSQVSTLSAQKAASLAEIENVAGAIKHSGITQIMENGDYQAALMDAWKSGRVQVDSRQGSQRQSTLPYDADSMSGRQKVHKKSRGDRGHRESKPYRHRKH